MTSLSARRRRRRGWTAASLLLSSSLASLLFACGSAEDSPLGNGKPQDGGDGDSLNVPDGDGDGDDGDVKCRREVTLEGVMLTTPPPFDVVIIADNSESLSWSREDLAQGLSDLVANVHGHSVRFTVLTPTQYGESSAAAIDLGNGDALVKWRDPASLDPYTSPVTRYVQTCTDELGQELVCPDFPPPPLEFELEGEWEFVMPAPVAELHSDMTTAELDTERSKVVDAILSLGTNGATEEQPLCTLTRYLKQSATTLPQRVAFLVIADEDDTSSMEGCLGGYEFTQRSSSSSTRDYNCGSTCENFEFRMSRIVARNRLNFSCAAQDDLGNLAPESTWKRVSRNLSSTDDCGGTTSTACTSDEEQLAKSDCDLGDTVQDCERTCSENSQEQPCGLTVTESNVDYCNQSFSVGTTTYDNLLDFCNATREYSDWSSCTSRGFNVESNGGSWSSYGNTRPVVQAKTPGALIHLFHADAERMFGAENYFVESIVFTPDGPCVPAAGQSYATELMAISSSPEQVHPICESYAPALMHVDQFAQGLLQTEYTVVLEERESIVSVTVHSLDGSTRQLTPDDYQHDMATGQLVINRDALRAADLDLSVEVEDPCAPIIR